MKKSDWKIVGIILFVLASIFFFSVFRPLMLKHEQEKADKAKIEQLKTHQK